MFDITTVGIVPVPKWSAWETSSRDLSDVMWLGIGTLLVVEQSNVENRHRGVLYTGHVVIWYLVYYVRVLLANGARDTVLYTWCLSPVTSTYCRFQYFCGKCTRH